MPPILSLCGKVSDLQYSHVHTITARVSKDPLTGLQFALNYNKKD